MATDNLTPRDTLISVGLTCFGDRWQARMAEALGDYNPRGGPVTKRYIDMMTAGERRVPSWLSAALPRILAAEIRARRLMLEQVLEVATFEQKKLELLTANGFSFHQSKSEAA